MGAPQQQTDFYKVLGVSQDASLDELQRIYFRLHREHSPQKDPEGHQRISRAFNTLRDERARRYYDALRVYGDQTRVLLERALESMGTGNYLGASRHLKRVLTLQEDADGARDLLGACLLELGMTDEALSTYSTLVEKRPDVPLYWLRYGDVFLEKAEKSPISEKRPLIGSARYNYRQAIKLNKANTSPYLAIAKTYLEEDKHEQALTWAEKAVTIHKRVDVQHFEALFFICHIHAVAGHIQKVVNVGRRIEELVPNDGDTKLYVASMLAQTGLDLIENRAFEAANYFLKTANRFDPGNTDLNELQQRVDWIVEADTIWPRLENDGSIIHPIKALAALTYAEFSGKEIERGFDRTAQSIKAKMENHSPEKVLTSIELLITEYPQYRRFKPDMWNRMLASAREAAGLKPSYTGKSAPSPMVGTDSTRSKAAPSVIEPIPVGRKDWSPIIGAAAAVVIGILGWWLVPVRPIGALAGAILGWWLGSAIGRLL